VYGGYDHAYWGALRGGNGRAVDPHYATTYDTTHTKDERYTPAGARFEYGTFS
jgi:hypothetical protein